MLDVNNLCKSFGPSVVLNDVSFSLTPKMRAGLAGANGAGKSTLLKILAGLENRDSGSISFASPAVVGYLPQYLPDLSGQTIDQLLLESAGDLKKIEYRMRHIEQTMSTAVGNLLTNLMNKYAELSAKYQENGGYEIDYRIQSMLEGLGIGYLDRSRYVESLSGGEKTRLSLASMLLKDPDLLLLDEPTNNLDTLSLHWLEKYLTGFKGTIMAASHDREFLNNIVKVIYEIDEHSHRLKKYTGDYDAYKLAKRAERVKWDEDYRNQQEEIGELKKRMKSAAASSRNTGHPGKSRDNDKFIPYFKSQRKQDSVSRNIRDAEERLKRIQENPLPKPPRPLRFKADFKSQNIKSAEVIGVTGLMKSFGTRIILRDLTFSLSYDSRVVISGINGSGKTTLLRILTGKDIADEGQVMYAPDVRIGFLPQEAEYINPGNTLLEHYSQGLMGYAEDFIFGLVTCGLFRYEELNKKVGQLSLGQVRKLQIARLIAEEPNILILDEPTNHISLDTLESFEESIKAFQGPVIVVSHDRRFIRQFGGEVWELKDGRLINKGKGN
jgi:macrolide transport system ATP-binding/permease protein